MPIQRTRGTKLTEAQVEVIKATPAKISNLALGRAFGVSDVTIGKIRRGEAHKKQA